MEAYTIESIEVETRPPPLSFYSATKSFYRTTLFYGWCAMSPCPPVCASDCPSVCLSVCHKSVFISNQLNTGRRQRHTIAKFELRLQ